MEDAKLVGLLLNVRNANWEERLHKYLHDIDNCRSEKQLLLFKYFYDNQEEWDVNFLTEENVYRSVFSEDEAFNSIRLRDTASALVKKVEDFIAIEAFKRSPLAKKKMLAEGYQLLQMDKQQEVALKRPVKRASIQAGIDFHWHELMRFHDLYYKPQANLHKEKKFGEYLRSGFFHIGRLEACFRLKFSTTVLIRKELYGEQPSEGFEKKLQAYLDDFESCKDAVIEVYRQTAQFFLTPSLERYEQLKEYYLAHLKKLLKERAQPLNFIANALFLIDYPGGRLREYFKLYKLGIKHRAFVNNGIMSPAVFNNILHVAHMLKEYVWAEGFVKEHINYLRYDRQTIENILLLVECYRLYGEEDFQGVLVKLAQILYPDFTYAIRRYILLFKCTYEIDKHSKPEFLKKRARAFRSYLQGREDKDYLSEENRLRYENFIEVFMAIVVHPYRKNSTKEKLSKLLASKGGQIVERDWLEEKIESLRGK